MKAALFDLDGVIIDTEPSYSIFWGSMGEKYHLPVDDFANVIKGTTLTQILDKYFTPEVHQDVVAQLVEYEQNMRYQIFPGVMGFLQKLRAKQIPAAIVTSSNLEKMRRLWSQHPSLHDYFDVLVTDEDVTHSKPDPEPYLTAAKRVGVDTKEAWVFEDSINGLLSGRRAGCNVVALATTNPVHLLSDKSDLVINSFDEFPIRLIN